MKLIVIDVQKGITDERLYDFDGFIRNVTNIIDAARKNNVKVILFSMMMALELAFLLVTRILG